jgi:cell division protein ZapA
MSILGTRKETLNQSNGNGAANSGNTSSASNSVRVEIFDQVYNLRGSDASHLLKLAEFVDGKIRAVSASTHTIDSARLAVLAALNIADEYLILKRKYEAIASEVNHSAHKLVGALDEVLQDGRRIG